MMSENERGISPAVVIPIGLGLGLAAALMVFAQAWAAPPGARFRISNLVISPTEVNPQQAVTISCTVTNVGDEAGSYTLKLEGDFVADQSVTLQPGESKLVSFEAVPHEARVYQVAVNGLTGSFTVIPMPVGNFVYSGEFFELRPYRELVPGAGLASCYVVYRCTITNQSPERGKRTISFYYQCYSTYYGKYYDPEPIKTFELTLEPYESYQFVFDPRINSSDLCVLAHGTFIWYIYLLDDAGGESAHLSAM